ncbi:hypothetical protein I8751_13685 [Nostocaceae cyanobacterium CENA357]|uniref:Uncharacterized protein n=1 Tax=Atlanticothrix silvestris CENA357 TaxID=1725252 RepID=A0A8J7HDJ4_9CYAN|nr:hypothetical protein [Atlanticothrix silvestris]MBH8553407.1 hypothetical protein [Atlanticothrix silvestris CENA357]
MSRVIIKLSSCETPITIIPVDDEALKVESIRNNIGDSSSESSMSILYKCFEGMPEVMVICDALGILKELPVTIQLPDHQIAGDVVICEFRSKDEKEEYDFYGMSIEKSAKVLKLLFPYGMNMVTLGGWK